MPKQEREDLTGDESLHKRLGTTTVYVTHDQIAPPDELFARLANLFVAGFIGSPGMNVMSATAAPGRWRLFGQDVVVRRDTGPLIADRRPEHLSPSEGRVSPTIRPAPVESLGSEKYICFDAEGARHAETSGRAGKRAASSPVCPSAGICGLVGT